MIAIDIGIATLHMHIYSGALSTNESREVAACASKELARMTAKKQSEEKSCEQSSRWRK